MGHRLPSDELEREIGSLGSLYRTELIDRWRKFYRTDPPKGISTQLMVRAISYKLQARHYGGPRSAIERQLEEIARGKTCSKPKRTAAAPTLDPGARLVREWNGATHTVDVTSDGFEWRGEQYGSLSAIAREITGARWSGPRFFGLNGTVAP